MKNQKALLIPGGRWKIVNFYYGYGQDFCMCCGRNILRCFEIKNADHDEKVSLDPTYSFPEKIVIGCICGPALFKESCQNFYDDPGMEWARQYAVFKDYVNYILLCVKNNDTWERVTVDLRVPVDEFLDGKWKLHNDSKHTGIWWRARDAKKKVLKSGKDKRGNATPQTFNKHVRKLREIAIQLQIIPEQPTQTVIEKSVA